MAEVYGEFGDQPIQLNNAATEATLKEILAAILKAGIAGKGGKASKEAEEKLKKLAKQVDELTDAQKEALKKQEEANDLAEQTRKQKEKELEETKKLGAAYRGLLDSVEGVIVGMTNMLSTLSRLDNSMTSAAQSMSAIPLVGNTLATVFGAVAGAADRTYKSFQQAAAVGANFGGSITEMVNAASGAGLTFDQFSGIVSRTGSDLALLGGTTAQGAKRLAQLGKEIKGSPLGDDLARMGYTTEQINESMAKYSGTLARTGSIQNMTNAQLVQSTGQYLQNLDAVSKLTGLNKKDLEAQREAMLRDAQIRSLTRKMDVTSREELLSFLQTIPEGELREGAKEVIATGTATSEAGRAFLTYMNKTGTSFVALNGQIQNTGKFTRENARELNSMMRKEAKEFSDTDLADNQRKFGDSFNRQLMVTIEDFGANQKTLGEVDAQTLKDREERAKKEKELGAQVDPAKLKSFQEKIAMVSNQFTNLLMNSGLLDSFMKVFGTMISFVEYTIAPAFSFLADNAGLVALVMSPLIVLMGVMQAAMAANTLATNLDTIAKNGGIKATFLLAANALKAAGGLFAMALPFIKIIAVVGLLYLGFKLLTKYWDDIVDGFLRLLNIVSFGKLGISKEEAEKRKSAREAKRIQDEQNQSTKEATELQKKENDAKKEGQATPATPGGAYDLSTPEKMFESAMRRQQGAARQPGATGVPATSGPVQDQIKSQLAAKGITDPKAVANIMAQVQAESGFKPQSENLNYSGKKLFEMYGAGNKGGNKVRFNTLAEAEALAAKGPEAVGNMIYGGRMGNAGDEGFKYRGRGLIQLTGKDNYKKFGDMIGVDLVKNPDLANDPTIASQIAAAYFAEKQKQGVNLTDIAAVGKAVGYAGGPAETAKRAQMAQAFLPGGTSATPTATAAQTAVAQAPTTTTPSTTTPVQTAQAPAATQENPATLLASLNTKMDVLISLNRKANDTRDRQLSAARSSPTDVSAWAAA